MRGRRHTPWVPPASRRATNCSLSSITEHSFHGIALPPLSCKHLTDEGEKHDDTRMSVSCAKEILPQWILHISATLAHQRCQQKVASVLNCRHNNQGDPRHQFGFASHRFSFPCSHGHRVTRRAMRGVEPGIETPLCCAVSPTLRTRRAAIESRNFPDLREPMCHRCE